MSLSAASDAQSEPSNRCRSLTAPLPPVARKPAGAPLPAALPTLSILSILMRDDSVAASPRSQGHRTAPSVRGDAALRLVGAPPLPASGRSLRCGCGVSVAHHEAVHWRDAKPHVRYSIAMAPIDESEAEQRRRADGGHADEGWCVWRRFSQFVELDHELHRRYHHELRRVRATLPSKFRFPSPLEVEGDERRPHLDAYLQRLLSSPILRQSEQLKHFLTESEKHRRLWRKSIQCWSLSRG